MTHGKNICNQLKEVRKRIAEENDIPLETEECSYKGECRLNIIMQHCCAKIAKKFVSGRKSSKVFWVCG